MISRIFGFFRKEKPKPKHVRKTKPRAKFVHLKKYKILEIRKMKRNGMTVGQISAKTGISTATVSYHVKNVNVKNDAERLERLKYSHKSKLPQNHHPSCPACFPSKGMSVSDYFKWVNENKVKRMIDAKSKRVGHFKVEDNTHLYIQD